MIHLPAQIHRRLSIRENPAGFRQALGMLAIALGTGATAFILWRTGHGWLALLALIAHGNVCSLFNCGIHELAHGTVFRSRSLNRFFLALYGFLHWTNARSVAARHRGHHTSTLHPEDPELPGSCHVLWLGTWLWSLTFNLPRFLIALTSCPIWLTGTHLLLALAFLWSGAWELIVLVTLAPFLFGFLATLFIYAQHGGMKLDRELVESTRSCRPGPVS
jgi:fatty acid desaturase